jgi:hypothetical protein
MHSSRFRALVAAVVAVLGLTACSGSGSGGSADASSTTTRAAPTTVPAPTAPAATVSGASDTCPSFRGATSSLSSEGPTAPAFLVDATAGAQGCLDVVTLTFQTRGDGTPPGYVVAYRDQVAQPFQDGDPPSAIEVPGAATLAVTVAPAASRDASVEGSPQTYTGNLSLDYGDHHHLVIVRELPDGKDAAGQDTVNWVIGLDSVRPFRVDRAANPPRVMVLIG